MFNRLILLKSARSTLAVFFFIAAVFSNAYSQPYDTSYLSALKWRMIGPHRGGRTVGATGVIQQPNVFYIGVNNGGVWKTTDYGRTWNSVFDKESTGSIGDVAVAPSNPDIVYAASGEGIQRPDLSVGNGVYRSADAGKSWQHMGLEDGQQIGGVAIDPTNANRVFAAVMGHPYGPNTMRGVYRSTDGGKNWERVLYKDENTGAAQVAIDPTNPNIIYADLWAGRQAPWENGSWSGKQSGLFKSTDGGTTWKQLTIGLPTTDQGLGRIGFCVAPSNTSRMYATVDAGEHGGIYRSDDAGESWSKLNSDRRFWGRGDDFAEVKVDPKNADVVYTADVVVWRSADGGKSWNAFRGAPGGDDYHRIWINPVNTDIMLIACDQGGIVTVNGGQSFSSWYNQPTAQFYHVSTDNSYPYNVYGGQQESGSVGISSRGNDGQITFHEWHPVGVEEYGYVAADPLDPNIIYGGKVTRYDKRTGQVQEVAPEAVRSGKYRFLRTAPLLFAPTDPHVLYFAGNVVFKTADGAHSWKVISPDLTRPSWDLPDNIGVYKTEQMKQMPRRGVIYTIAPSSVDGNSIWAGTDDGLIHVTHDGGLHWNDVTPHEITSWSKISLIEAGHSDAMTAYAAVNRIRLDDMHPHIYRTHDGGKSWKEIVNGLPIAPVNAVREDPKKKGLLFAGSETSVYVSFDDGEHWQSLRNNMPPSSMRDMVIKDDDLVLATHGRSFWILDDISPLRQMTDAVTAKKSFLFKPQTATRVRWNMGTDTPLPQEEPGGQNPPDGAVIDYYLNSDAAGEVILEITDPAGKVIRHYSSKDTLYDLPDVNIPLYWVRPQQTLSGTAGSHRFLWDLRYQPLNVPASFPIGATFANTAPTPTAPWVIPGSYVVKLTVGGTTYQQKLSVRIDPRVKTTMPDLQLVNTMALSAYRGRLQCMQAALEIEEAIAKIKEKQMHSTGEDANKLMSLSSSLQNLLSTSRGSEQKGVVQTEGSFGALFGIFDNADSQPTSQSGVALKETEATKDQLMAKWAGIKKNELAALHL